VLRCAVSFMSGWPMYAKRPTYIVCRYINYGRGLRSCLKEKKAYESCMFKVEAKTPPTRYRVRKILRFT
jgi:hypothetical protein